jgi:nicotinate-nucleotide adenylyltransferase
VAEGARAPARIGLFGGSFDPVHAGHVHAARSALEAFDLERVYVVPAARPPHKLREVLAPAADRVAMLELAFAGDPRFVVSDVELRRAGPSFTIDTVRALEERHGGSGRAAIHLVLGDDSLEGLPEWRAAEELLARVQPVVVDRGGDPAALLRTLAGRLSPGALARLSRGVLAAPPLRASATELRRQLARGGDPGPLLPPGVHDYIRAHGLYRSAAEAPGA